MARGPRRRGASNIYHVVARGSGRQLIFEDDADRSTFLGLLSECLGDECELLAWCLMSNHFHLLLEAEIDTVSLSMKRIESEYARRFNRRHGRIGHLFQDRFSSEPIEDDAYLLTVVRYIHMNPEKEGLCRAGEYRWSSYGDYMTGKGVTSTSMVLDMLGGIKGFAEFHKKADTTVPRVTQDGPVRNLPDDRARELATEILGEKKLRDLATLDKLERNEAIRTLLQSGFTIRQIERLSGIGRGIIQRVRVSMGT